MGVAFFDRSASQRRSSSSAELYYVVVAVRYGLYIQLRLLGFLVGVSVGGGRGVEISSEEGAPGNKGAIHCDIPIVACQPPHGPLKYSCPLSTLRTHLNALASLLHLAS